MSLTNTAVNSIKLYLASQFMYVEEEWLNGCVEYLSQDNENRYSEAEMKNLARDQWLLNDLKDICPGSLPANLKNLSKTVLKGNFVLQINAAVDIGTPAYQQYLKLQKVNTENIEVTSRIEDKIPAHRMIKLYLTDGVQDVSAIEYKPMRNLNCDITPGCKALIKGPVQCRRGIIMLSEGNLELLGGEVENITMSNSLPCLLSSKLGMEYVPNTNQNSLPAPLPRNSDIPQPHRDIPTYTSTKDTSHPNIRPVARVTALQVTEDDIDFDEIAALEAEFSNESGKRLLDYDNTSQNSIEKKRKVDTEIDIDLFFNEDEDHFRELESEIDKQVNLGPVPVNSEPFVYIKQINELTFEEKNGKTFRIKGQILKLLSKLSVGKDGWSLRCNLVDGTGGMDVDFTSDVLTKLVGYSPSEMNNMKREMSSKPELKEKAIQALHRVKDTLQVLCSIIEITIIGGPKITGIHPYEMTHVNMLRDRSNL